MMCVDPVLRQSNVCPFSSQQTILIPDKTCINPGSPPYLENLECCHFLFQAWKMPGICSKSGKNLELLSQNLEKNLKFANSMSQA